MDFYAGNSALSMNGSSSFSEIIDDIATLNDTVVFKSGAQTITGDKTLSGTTTITGDITANAVNITPTELGFIGGLTSDAQTQLNGKVGISNPETITGDKTFTGATIFGGTVVSNNDFDNNGTISNYSNFNNNGTFTNKPTGIIELESGSEIIANGVSISPIEMSYLNNVSSNLQTQLDGKVSKTIADTISAIKTFSVLPESSVVPTTNSQLANKKYVDDTIVAGAFVSLAGTQTITGNKTFSGTTTFTGDITANAVNITPTELGYIGGLTSDAQTQITARALDSNVVHKSGTETVNGDKTFTGTTVVAYTNANTNIQFANIPNYTFIDMCSGGNSDYDVRLSSAYAGTSTAARGNFSIEAGRNYLAAYGSGSNGWNKLETTGGSGSYNQLVSHQNYIDAAADNILRIGGTNRLSMNANTTTLTNQYNTLNATITNLLSATTTGSQNYLFTSGTNSNNLLEASGTGSYNYLNAPSNTINASSGGTNYIRVSGIDKLVIRSDATTAADQMIAPIYKIGTYASSVPLLSFQIHGVKNGANALDYILFGPCYNFTSTDKMYNYQLPCNIEFTRATLMFDTDTTTSGTLDLNFYRTSTNTGTPALVHSQGQAYSTSTARSYSFSFPINTGSPLTYNAGEFISVIYANSPGNEWGIVFHGFQY